MKKCGMYNDAKNSFFALVFFFTSFFYVFLFFFIHSFLKN